MKLPKRVTVVLMGMCFVAAFFLVKGNIEHTSVTFDEPLYVGSGAYLLKNQDYSVDSLWYNGPVSYYINSVILLFTHSELFKRQSPSPQFGNGFGQHLLTQKPTDQILHQARYPFIGVFLSLIVLMFSIGTRLFSPSLGCVAAMFTAFSPMLVAHASVATMDLTITFFVMLTFYFFLLTVELPSKRNFIFIGMGMALACCSKPSGIMLFPIVGTWMFLSKEKLFEKILIQKAVLCVGLGFMGVVWGLYGFRVSFLANEMNRPHTFLDLKFTNIFLRSLAYFFAEHIPIPAPEFWKMLFVTPFRLQETRWIYFLGQTAQKHFYLYFPVALFIKSTLAEIFLFCTSLGVFVIKFKLEKRVLHLWAAFLIILCFGMTQQQTLGLRYVLPLYPFFILLGVHTLMELPKKTGWIVFACLSLYQGWTTLNIYPNHLSYFNEGIGGAAEGHKYLLDSDLDWGQNLPTLKDWIQKNRVDYVVLGNQSMFDVAKEVYGVSYEPISCVEKNKIIVVSKTILLSSWGMGQGNCLEWLKNRKKIAEIDHSMWIFNDK